MHTVRPKSRTGRSAGLACLIVLGGCSRLQVKLGRRVYLAQTPVVSMTAMRPGDPGIAPGGRSPVVVTFVKPDGRVLTTEGKGRGKVLWQDIAVTASVVSANRKGVLSLPQDPRVSDGQTGHVTLTVPSHPGLKAEMEIPLRYDAAFAADFSGGNGNSGSDGTNGVDGMSGSMGSLDPDHPSAGGNGTSGTNGGEGGRGGSGDDGAEVAVRVSVRAGSGHPLLEIGVRASGGQESYYLVDPQGGSLRVSANGGSGGSGGKGGQGGRGGAGGIGIPSGSSGNNGTPGQDGLRGWDGSPGRITVTYDPAVQPFLGAIRVPQGTVFKEERVGLLW